MSTLKRANQLNTIIRSIIYFACTHPYHTKWKYAGGVNLYAAIAGRIMNSGKCNSEQRSFDDKTAKTLVFNTVWRVSLFNGCRCSLNKIQSTDCIFSSLQTIYPAQDTIQGCLCTVRNSMCIYTSESLVLLLLNYLSSMHSFCRRLHALS